MTFEYKNPIPALAALLLAVAGACGGGTPAPAPAKPAAPAAAPAAATAVPGAAVAAPAAAVAKAEIDYNPQVLRDPFQPYVIPPEVEVTKDPLEYYDLSEMGIIGIISGIRDSRAKIKVKGEYYSIKRGSKMGKNRGVVVTIRGDEIVIRERYRDERTHGYQYKDMCMRMEKTKTTVTECPGKGTTNR